MNARGIDQALEGYVNFFKNIQHVPHYKYVIRPLYRWLGGNNNPLFSVPATFIISDYLFHQLVENFTKDIRNGELSPATLFKLNIPVAVFWASASIPVAYYKYVHRNNRASQSTATQKPHQVSHTLFNTKKQRYHQKSKPRTISDEEMAHSCFGISSNRAGN